MKHRDLSIAILAASFWLLYCICILFFNEFIQVIHEDERAYWISSDGAKYLEHYYTYGSVTKSVAMWIHFASVGAPILMLFATGGKVFPLLLLACTIFFYSLYSCTKSLAGNRYKFFFAILIIPYVFFGLFAINKEIYVVSSTLFFLTYYNSLNKKYLLFCFLTLFLARYYMLLVFVFCLVVFPPSKKIIKWKLILAAFFFISLVAPLVLDGGVVRSYSSSGLLDNSGATASFFAMVTREYLYFLAYFPKYAALILSRFWTAFSSGIFGEIKGNLLGLIVAMYSVLIYLWLFAKTHFYRSNAFKYLMMVLFSPVPLMFIDVFHWRYYIFTLVMAIFYLAVRNTQRRLQPGPIHQSQNI